MAVISKANRKSLINESTAIESEIKKWSGYFEAIDNLIKKGKGGKFATEYPKGAKACKNIDELMTTLKKVKNYIKTMCSTVDTYIEATDDGCDGIFIKTPTKAVKDLAE